MGILDLINERVENEREKNTSGENKIEPFWNECLKVVEDVKNHLKEIRVQMPEYDIHDEVHSEKILEIIEKLLRNNMEKLTLHELMLIYLSAYLHDSGMALPFWEYELIKSIEGTEECFDQELTFKICNDFKPVHKYSDAEKLVKEYIYGKEENTKKRIDLEVAKNFVFASSKDDEIISQLAELICDYEEFRNGYVNDLRSKKDNVAEYLKYSKELRTEYIRSRHHIQSEKNIKALRKKFDPIIGKQKSKKFCEDLGLVCKCHGEDISELYKLDAEKRDWRNENSNLQFVAIMLRLGDVIDFSSSRAPISLFAEKGIKNEVSIKHWASKFQEMNYEFCLDDGKVKIQYSAFCSEPKLYYFIQEYLDWVDKEIEYYFFLKGKWEYNQIKNHENYSLSISNKVDRVDVSYDNDKFKPSNNLKFVLNQAKILELLMGVQLYKDKYLCLRELYQNALDASKCMLAHNEKEGISEKLSIEFGLKEEEIDGESRKYIYCLDHGTGMNQYIIENYLLKVGTSYYKSSDFCKKNTNWNARVNPTSQFGVGLLSCFMLADKISITTIHYENSNAVISFINEGINEYFYYVNANKVEQEMIGKHGTLIKLYLKPEYCESVNAKYFPYIPVLLDYEIYNFFKDNHTEDLDMKLISNNLFFILSKQIYCADKDISLKVKDDEDNEREIFYHNNLEQVEFYDSMPPKDLEKYWKSPKADIKAKSHLLSWKNNLEYLKSYNIDIQIGELCIHSHLTLPKKNNKNIEMLQFKFFCFIGNQEGNIVIDGICIDHGNERHNSHRKAFGSNISHDIVKNSIINFTGEVRPILSVDRNSIVRMPELTIKEKEIRSKFIAKLVELVEEHINTERLNTSEQLTVLDIVVEKFPIISLIIINSFRKSFQIEKQTTEKIGTEKGISIQTLFDSSLEIDLFDINNFKSSCFVALLIRLIFTEKIQIKNKCLALQGIEDDVSKLEQACEKINQYLTVTQYAPDFRLGDYFIFRAKDWDEEYQEYDIVNTYLPIVNKTFFDTMKSEKEACRISENCLLLASDKFNFVNIIMEMDPVLIHSVLGIGLGTEEDLVNGASLIGRFDFIFPGDGFRIIPSNLNSDKCTALFIYVMPRTLNEAEENELEYQAKRDQEYVEGIRNGWSILIMDSLDKYFIEPGKIARAEMVKKIPDSFKNKHRDKELFFTDGERLEF